MNVLSGSVGVQGVNRPADVKLVQMLLNDWRGRSTPPAELLEVDGIAGPLTNAAIRRFQTEIRLPRVDGRIDPGRTTITALTRAHLENLHAGVVRAAPPTYSGSLSPLSAFEDAYRSYLLDLRDAL